MAFLQQLNNYPKFPQRYFIAICLLALIGFMVYFNTFKNPFIWDDELLIIENPLIKSGSNFLKSFRTDIADGAVPGGNFYRPLQVISYQLDYFFWGLNPLGFHITNTILFILNAILVFFLVNLILKDFEVSFLSAVFFLVHPIYCEATAYISGRADLLVGIFFILGFISFIKCAEGKKTGWQVLLISSFSLALLSKELAIVFPLVLLVYEACFRKETFHSIKLVFQRFGSVFFIEILYIILRFKILNFGAIFIPVRESIILRLLIVIKATNAYLGILFVPVDMHMLRDFPRPSFEPVTIISSVSFLILLFFIIYFFKKQRVFFFFSVWFFLTLLPQSGIFPINSYISEHFIYLPAIGFFVIFSYYLLKLKKFDKRIFYVVVFSIVSFYSIMTILHNLDWRSQEDFFGKIVSRSPRSALARRNLSSILLSQGRYKEALQESQFSSGIDPFNLQARLLTAQAYKNLKEYDKAIEKMKEILKAAPNYEPALMHISLGDCYYVKKDYDTAIKEYRVSLKLNPKENLATSSHLRLALIYFKKSRDKLALGEIGDALGIDSKLLLTSKFPTISDYKKLVELEDSEAVMVTKIGMLYFNHKLYDLAKAAYKKAIDISPNYADPYWHLGAIFYQEGNKKEGLKLWDKAYKLDPKNPIAISWRENQRLH